MKFENNSGDSVTVGEKGVVVNMASGGRIVLGNWGDIVVRQAHT